MKISLRSAPAALAILLAACSGGPADHDATPTAAVAAAMPVRQTFHAQVPAFGELAADSRGALALSVPQAVEILAIDVLPGHRVKRGEALLRYASDPLTRSAYLQAQTALRVARDDLARTERLHADKLATGAQLDAARKAVTDAQAALAAQAKLGGAQAVRALTAPADGVVTALAVQRGQRAAAGATLVEFAPEHALAAQLAVDPGAAAGVRAGMRVALRPVYAAPGAPPLAATVAQVGDAVNPQTREIDVVARLAAPTTLAAGSALTATIETAAFSAWAVPRSALQSDAQGDFVYQVERGKAHRVDVKVLAPQGSPVGVEGPLDPAAPVITAGSYEVGDGDPVRSAPAPGTSAR